MRFGKTARLLEGIPHISRHSARVLYDFICTETPEECLELGFAHGASSGYIAAALDESGRGHLTSVDIQASADFTPRMEDTIQKLGLAERVSIFREKNSYTWFLKKKIEEQTRDGQCVPCYDFVFIDGSKNWTIDGMAFFLADKLLRDNGWLLFDDYDWRYADAAARGKDTADGITLRSLPEDQIAQPNVRAIFELLVAQHPEYSNCRVQDNSWAWAQKTAGERRIQHARKSTLNSRFARLKAGLGQ